MRATLLRGTIYRWDTVYLKLRPVYKSIKVRSLKSVKILQNIPYLLLKSITMESKVFRKIFAFRLSYHSIFAHRTTRGIDFGTGSVSHCVRFALCPFRSVSVSHRVRCDVHLKNSPHPHETWERRSRHRSSNNKHNTRCRQRRGAIIHVRYSRRPSAPHDGRLKPDPQLAKPYPLDKCSECD